MRIIDLSVLLFLICFRKLVLSAEADSKQQGLAEFPEPLTEAQFNSEIKSGLHILDFYSPYCSHCLALAPIWKKTWETFQEEGKMLNITFSQIDCIQNGDLCAREKITAFPSIRLYGPSGYIKNFPDSSKRSMETLIDFARQEAYDPANMEAVDMKSSSELMTGEFFKDLLAGKGNKPYLVSFWPSRNMKSSDDNLDFENCEECPPFQRAWKVLSKKLASSNISTGHINCHSSASLCNELGFDDLVNIRNHRADRYPRVALVLPKKHTNNLFLFGSKYSTSLSDYEDFAKRIYFNSQTPDISVEEISQIVQKDFQLSQLSDFAPVSQKIHVVFSYNPETTVPEDLHVLEYLIEPLSKIPNVYLYKSKEDMKKATKLAFNQMYEMINYNKSEPEKTPKQEYLDVNVMPQNPALYLFRDGDSVPHMYHGYSTTEMRNVDMIVSWIEELSLPVFNEINPSSIAQLLKFEPQMYSGIAIQVVDTSDRLSTEKSNKYLTNFKLGAYDYEDVRMQSVVDRINAKRTQKAETSKALKKKGASSKAIVAAAVKEIPHLDDSKIILGYLDISRSKSGISKMGFGTHEKDYKVGDVFVLHKPSKYLYKYDAFGNVLTADSPYIIRETLVAVLLPEKSLLSKNMSSRLLNSPYSDTFKLFDVIHRYGFWGYSSVLLLIVIICRGLFKYKNVKVGRKYRAKRNTVGLLGKYGKKKLKD